MRAVTYTCLSLSFWLAGCAGPATPFGAIDGFSSRVKEAMTSLFSKSAPHPAIQFSPERQFLHGATPFSITIEDMQGIPEDAGLALVFNGEDVTKQFLRKAERLYSDPLHRRLKLTIRNLRLLPDRENKIYVVYRRDEKSPAIVSQYLPPSCSAFETVRELASIPLFDPAPGVLKSINRFANERQFNPYFVAGLIAQESSFDPLALSRSKAMGLTQITALGEGEVIKRFSDWPRHPEVNEMSLVSLRLAILRGKINSANEWRLNPELSIRGGVEYLSYLMDYWGKPEKRAQVEKNLGISDLALSEVMLASYNSGAWRVSSALERRGADWLADSSLNEARKYVRRVTSYCDHFAGEGR